MRMLAAAVLVAYITFWVTLAAGEIGTTTSSGTELSWEFPVQMLLWLGFPALLGLFIGQNSRE